MEEWFGSKQKGDDGWVMGDNGSFDIPDVGNPVFILSVYDIGSSQSNSVLSSPINFNHHSSSS